MWPAMLLAAFVLQAHWSCGGRGCLAQLAEALLGDTGGQRLGQRLPNDAAPLEGRAPADLGPADRRLQGRPEPEDDCRLPRAHLTEARSGEQGSSM